MKLGLILIATSLFLACGSNHPPVAPEVIQVPDGGSFDEPPDMSSGGYAMPACARACVNLQTLGCPEAAKYPGEDSCYVVCKRAESTGKIDFNLPCVEKASTREELRACKTYRCL